MLAVHGVWLTPKGTKHPGDRLCAEDEIDSGTTEKKKLTSVLPVFSVKCLH